MNMVFSSEICTELKRAEAARISGNEGRARVCARRAAGMAARDFLSRRKGWYFDQSKSKTRSGSVFEVLQTLSTFPGVAPHLKQAAVHLTMRINEEFQLPLGIDLIDEAYKLIGGLK
jgi:hypothetical protein